MIEAAENSSEIQFETKIEDVDDALTKEAEISLYRIMQECLNNILKHSKATEVDITLNGMPDGLILHIQDNGIGIDFKPFGQDLNGSADFVLIN